MVKKRNKRWRPSKSSYYAINSKGMVIICPAQGRYTKARYKFGNMFKTKEEAESALDRVSRALLAKDPCCTHKCCCGVLSKKKYEAK